MKLQAPQNIANLKTVEELAQYVSSSLGKIHATLNGNVDLLENSANAHLTFVFTKINTDYAMPHGLGVVPRGYMQSSSTNSALSLQNGSKPNTATTIFLQAGSTGTVSVVVF